MCLITDSANAAGSAPNTLKRCFTRGDIMKITHILLASVLTLGLAACDNSQKDAQQAADLIAIFCSADINIVFANLSNRIVQF